MTWILRHVPFEQHSSSGSRHRVMTYTFSIIFSHPICILIFAQKKLNTYNNPSEPLNETFATRRVDIGSKLNVDIVRKNSVPWPESTLLCRTPQSANALTESKIPECSQAWSILQSARCTRELKRELFSSFKMGIWIRAKWVFSSYRTWRCYLTWKKVKSMLD